MTSIAGNELMLQRLTAGEAEPVLVVDFQAFSAAPRLSQLLSDLTKGRPVYQVDPVGVLSGDQRYASLPDLAAACVGAFLDSGPADGRVFVVGHCSAAALSLHIARMLEGRREIAVILVHPTWPDEKYVRIRFADFQASLQAESRPCPDLDGDSCRSVAQMEQILRDGLAARAVSLGLDGSTEAFSDLLGRYRGWLAFLLACRNDLPGACATRAATVKVLTDAPAGIDIPWLSPDAYQISRVPTVDLANPITPELASLVLAQIVNS
jgi:hypothetical protein